MSMSSGLTRKRKHSDVSAVLTASHQQKAIATRDNEAATEIAHSSTARFDNCVAQDHARVQYGNTYVQNQYNGHTLGPQEHPRNTKQQIDFVEALAFNHMDSRFESIDSAHINTCQWLFQKSKYLQWRDPEYLASHNGFLWIKGKAGSGKSTLMKCAFEHAETFSRNGKVISFFFNARGQPLEKSVEGMYRSLLSQILRHFPQLRLVFPRNGPEYVRQHGWTVPALRNHLRRAITSLGQGEAITLYIDALDECEEEDIREAIEHFEELGSAALSMPITLHICFASRYYPRVTIQHCIEIHLEAQTEHQQDIRKYINDRLAIRDIAFKVQLASKIEARASGVFFWVVLVVRLIRKRCDGGASQSVVLQSLQEIPDKLQELIGAILRSSDDALLCTMRWMIFARRSLALEELYFAVRTGTGQLTSGIWDTSEINRDGMEAFILAASRGLVEVESDIGYTKVQLIHESVREYLITGGLQDLGPCSDDMVAARNHVRLFEWCQTYLRCIAEKHLLTVDGVDGRNSSRVRKTYPPLTYARHYILHHLEASYTVGLLRLDVLREFPLRQYIYLDRHSSVELYQQLLQPNSFFLSLLYQCIYRSCAKLAEALLAEISMHLSRFDDRVCNSAAASTSVLLTSKIDLNFRFEGRWSSLLELAVERCPGLVHSLLDQGADVNIDGGAPLCMAVEYCGLKGRMEDVVLSLLRRGARVQVITPHGTTALALAVSNCNLAIVTLLLEHGADANGVCGTTAVSPLLAALISENPNALDLDWAYNIAVDSFDERVDEGIDEDMDEDIDEDTDDDILRVLLDHGADVYLRAGPKHISPLQFAAAHRSRKINRLLWSYGERRVDGAGLTLDPAARRESEG